MWTFTNRIPPERAARLAGWRAISEIQARLNEAVVTAFVWEPARSSHLTGCSRATFQLALPKDLYDGLFNAPCGLRAAYAVSVDAGERATRRCMDALRQSLIRFALAQKSCPAQILLERSIDGNEAKIWIDEEEVKEQLGSCEPDLNYPRWEELNDSGVGLLAPLGQRWEAKGSWISLTGREVLNPEKANRSAEIHERGYT